MSKHEPWNGSNMPKVLHNTTKVRVVAQDCKLAPSHMQETYHWRKNMPRSSHSLGAMVTPLVAMASNKLIPNC
jgi:hypothetical protein